MRFKSFACFVLLVLGGSMASAQQSPSLTGSLVDWPQFNFDSGHDGYNPYETILSTANVGSVTLNWSYAPSEGPVQGQPAIANGMAYFVVGSTDANSGAVYAFDASTGALVWKFSPGGLLLGPPSTANGLVYVSTNYVYALDANTGTLVWQAQNSGGISTTVANNVVYAQNSEDAGVDALNASTGAMIWHYPLGGFMNGAPTVASGIVYISAQSGAVYALNAGTGAVLWIRQLGISPTPAPTPYGSYGGLSVANGVVYVEAANPKPHPPLSYNVWALDANTGATIWKSQSIGVVSRFGTTPAVANGMVYVGAGGSVQGLNASTGAAVWQYQPSADVVGSPIVANGVVYAGSSKYAGEGTDYYTMSALNAATGTLVWNSTEFQGEDDVIVTPAVVNGTIYGRAILNGGMGAFALPNQ